jgi:cytochrome c oxidase subunit 2
VAGIAAMVSASPVLAAKYIPTSESSYIPDNAAGWEHLWTEVLIDISVLGAIFAVVLALLIWKYRSRPGVEGGGAPQLSTVAAIGWALIPGFLFMADDFYIAANGWQLWNNQRTVPADRLEVSLESGMYSWDYTYANGIHTQNELRVPAGKPVLLRMTSRDTIHDHYIPDFKVKEDSMPGRVTYMWFYPKDPGKHLVVCNEYCGIMHSYMSGQIIVMPPEEYQAWYEQEGAKVKQTPVNDAAGQSSALLSTQSNGKSA